MGFHSGRHFLQIPGPTNVPERVLRAIAAPVIDHRGPRFAQLGLEVLRGLRALFKTTAPVVIYPATCRSARASEKCAGSCSASAISAPSTI